MAAAADEDSSSDADGEDDHQVHGDQSVVQYYPEHDDGLHD